jgi:hypothetical protein
MGLAETLGVFLTIMCLWARLEHRLTVIETNCKFCKGKV